MSGIGVVDMDIGVLPYEEMSSMVWCDTCMAGAAEFSCCKRGDAGGSNV